jgi:predicted esterase YcpF (UPF0227 family)
MLIQNFIDNVASMSFTQIMDHINKEIAYREVQSLQDSSMREQNATEDEVDAYVKSLKDLSHYLRTGTAGQNYGFNGLRQFLPVIKSQVQGGFVKQELVDRLEKI